MTEEGVMYLSFVPRVGKDKALEILEASGVVPRLTDVERNLLERQRVRQLPAFCSDGKGGIAYNESWDIGKAIERLVVARPK